MSTNISKENGSSVNEIDDESRDFIELIKAEGF